MYLYDVSLEPTMVVPFEIDFSVIFIYRNPMQSSCLSVLSLFGWLGLVLHEKGANKIFNKENILIREV